MFLIELTYKCDLATVDSLLSEHQAFLDQYYQAGHFYFSGRKIPRLGGLILANFPTREAAEAAIGQDPFHQQEVADYRIIEFEPTRANANFAHLVNQPGS